MKPPIKPYLKQGWIVTRVPQRIHCHKCDELMEVSEEKMMLMKLGDVLGVLWQCPNGHRRVGRFEIGEEILS